MNKTHLYRIISCSLLTCLPAMLPAQIPGGYYDGTANKKECELKTALSSRVSIHEERTYKQLCQDFMTTDVRQDGTVCDMYSSAKHYTFLKEQCGTYKNEGDCYKKDSIFTPDDYYPYLCATDTLSLLSFNDFHGAFVKDRNVPGAGELVQAVLYEKAKNKNTIVVSVGDNFSGSYFSRISRGNPLPEMFKKMDVKMSAIGNHEFDWGLPYLIDTASVCMKYIAANIVSKENKQPLEWLQPYKIIGQRMKNGGYIHIAFVGLSTTDTAVKTSPENIRGLDFINPEDAARIQIATNLKKEGKVDMVVLLVHIGTNMANQDIIEEDNAKRLPWVEGVDAIISGHSHKVVLAERNSVPIIQAGVNGTHIGKLNFEVKQDLDNYKFRFIGGDTIRVSGGSDPAIDSLVNKVTDLYGFEEVLTTADDDLIHDRNINKNDYTPVGAYVTASYADAFRKYNSRVKRYNGLPVIGANHYGGLRASILKGEVTKLRAGNVLPFGGHVTAFLFNGSSLKKLLNDGRINKNGFLQTSNLSFIINTRGKIEKIIDLATGEEIRKTTKCIVVLDSFITTGGDGYKARLFRRPIHDFNTQNLEPTEVFIDYLRNLGQSISTAKSPMPKLDNKK